MVDINEIIMSNEAVIRLSFFLGIFAVMAIWEFIAPRRALTVSKVMRWTNNLGLVFLHLYFAFIVSCSSSRCGSFFQRTGLGAF